VQTLQSLGEVGLIARIAKRLPASSWVRRGIGDDAAVLRWPARQELLFASDMLVEGVHFRRGDPPRAIGWKALACNISDIAAMGGRPCAAVVSLGLPPSTPVRFVDALYAGLRACAGRFDVDIVGGDTVRAPQVVVDVAIIGRVAPGRAVLRSGARVGDRLFVTGRLGGSLRSGRHAIFVPRVREAQALVRRVSPSAMMDLSDGLASDLWQMARASRVTMRVEAARIPIARAAHTLEHALMDGEDFELLFTVPKTRIARVPKSIGRVPVTQIGRVTGRGAQVELLKTDGQITTILPTGFRHF